MNWKYWLVIVLFVVGGLGWLLKPLKQLIRGEPIEMSFLAGAIPSFTLAIVFFAVGRKARLAAESRPT